MVTDKAESEGASTSRESRDSITLAKRPYACDMGYGDFSFSRLINDGYAEAFHLYLENDLPTNSDVVPWNGYQSFERFIFIPSEDTVKRLV